MIERATTIGARLLACITVAATKGRPQRDRRAWIRDIRSGLNSGLYAWRRDNVAALNTAARAAWAAHGRLYGPNPYAAGASCPSTTPSGPTHETSAQLPSHENEEGPVFPPG